MNKCMILILLLLASVSVNAKKVRFSVDMTGVTVNSTGVHVSGDFQEEAGFAGGDWQSNTTVMTAGEGSSIYSVVVDIPAFAKYEYKFLNGDQWYDVEFVPLESRVGYNYDDNRWVYIDSLYNDTTNIPAVLFSGNAPAGFYLLRLKVDMSLQELVSPTGVHVAADAQNWDPAATILYSFGDSVYEQILYAEIWTDYAQCRYRFVNGNTNEGLETVPGDCSQDGNRFIEMTKDSVVETVCFSECLACDPQGEPEIVVPSAASICPNPLREFATLEFNDPETIHNVSVMDIFGNILRQYKVITAESLTISRENMSDGIYFVKIDNRNHWLCTLRLVISK
jgi:alpha-amylase